jgi:ABC-2 type transport system ATP-binding protein
MEAAAMPDDHITRKEERIKGAKSGIDPSLLRGSSAVINIKNLVKDYGRIQALKGVTLEVEKGEIFGLLGQNGAGKTTMVKLLLGIIRATEGTADLLGFPAGTVPVRRKVGYLPEDHRFPDYHTGASLLEMYGSLLEMPRARRQQRALEVLELVGLRGRMHYKIRTYSKGMKQRLGIAQALMHEPEVLFLDEPTDGVDPVGRREIRQMLAELKRQGTTIFLNSHLLGEVELICDRVIILERGEIIRQGTIAELTHQQGTYLIGLAPGQQFPIEEVRGQGYVVNRAAEHWEVVLGDKQTIDPVVAFLAQRGLQLRHLVEKRMTLEDLFVQTVEAVEPGVDDRPARPRRRVGDVDDDYDRRRAGRR